MKYDAKSIVLGAAYIGVAYYAINALMNRYRNAGQTDGLLGPIVGGRGKSIAASPYSITNFDTQTPVPTGYVDVMGHNHGMHPMVGGHLPGEVAGYHTTMPMGGYHDETQGYAGMLASQFGSKGMVGNMNTSW